MGEGPSSPAVVSFGLLSLSALVVGSALAVGTVHVQVLLWVGTAAVLLASALLFIERSKVRRLPAPALVLLALSFWSALQAAPLPLHFLEKIAPLNADIWARALRPFGEPPVRFGSISLDPGASYLEALKWFIYALVFTMAYRFGRVASGRAGIAIVFVSAVIVSLVTLAHGLIGATALYGIYTPELVTTRWGLSPILNPNNLSGYLNLGAFCGLGLLLSDRRGDEPSLAAVRAIIGAGIAGLVGVSVLGASRGGVLGLGLGILVLATFLVLLQRKTDGDGRSRRSSARTILPVVTALGGGALLAVMGASPATWSELRETSTEKVRLWEWSVPLIRDFPWFGVGRGAFETVFPAYKGVSGNIVFTHAENFILQWAAEWGLPVAVASLAALAWLCRARWADLGRGRVKLAAFVGVVVLLFQNLVDLALEIPAVAIALCTVLGSFWEPSQRAMAGGRVALDAAPRFPNLRRWRRKLLGRGARRLLGYAVFVGGAAALGLAFAFGRHPVDEERSELNRLYQRTPFSDPSDYPAFVSTLRAAVLRHPAEPYFPLLGAFAATRIEGAKVLPWVVAALERDVKNARAHLVLAGVLMRNHIVDQALMELRFAVQDDMALATPAGEMAGRLTHDLEKLDRSAPNGSAGAGMLFAAAMGLPAGETDLRLRLLDLAIERDPKYISSLSARAHALLQAASAGNPPCAGSSRPECVTRAKSDVDAIRAQHPGSCEPILLGASILEAEGDVAGAEAALTTQCGSCSELIGCLTARVSLAARLPSTPVFMTAARAYLGAACADVDRCLNAHLLVGDFFAQRGLWPLAVEEYQEAASKGRKADWWLRLADASIKAGQTGRASLALQRAKRDGSGDPSIESRIQALQTQLDDQQFGQR